MFLIDIVIICFIKYELDEFELNKYLCIIWCNINCDRDIVFLKREIPVLILIRMWIVCGFV